MLEELRHFVNVVEGGSFTKAARRSHLSQPALSQAIARLENELGATLFSRGRKGAQLTAEGRALLPHAEAVLQAARAGRRAVSEVAGLQAGEVSVGAGATAVTYLLPEVMVAFRAQYPGLRLRLAEVGTEEVQQGLQSGRFDLGIATASALKRAPWLHTTPYLRDELIVVRGPDAPWRRIEPGTPWVSFVAHSPIRQLVTRYLPEVDVVVELGAIPAVKAAVHAGIGLALVSRVAVERDLVSGRLVEVSDARLPLWRDLVLVHRAPERLSPAASALWSALVAGDSGV